MPTNKTVITVIISTLASCAALCVFAICYLSYKSIQIPPELNTLTGGLIGALTGMLVKTSPTEGTKAPDSGGNGGSTPVTIVNPPSDPVPTIET